MNPDELDAAVKALKAQGAPDEAVHAFLQSHGLKPVEQQGHDYHSEFASGALNKRMQGANARDVASASEGDAATNAGAGSGLATHLLNAAQGIPGMHALEAGAGALGSQLTSHPMGYKESYNTLSDATGKIGGKTAALERVGGSLLAAPLLPANPVAAGAILGGADQALSADPGQSVGGRAARTVLGAGAGAALGRVADVGTTGIRALFSQRSEANILARQLAQSESATRLYSKAMQQGQGNLGTAALQRFMAQPDIAEIVGELQQTRPFQGVHPESPEMFDAVYKTLSDRMQTVKKGLESVRPNKPNIGRFAAKDIRMAQEDALDAASGGASLPGPMPAYRTAVNDFATRERGIEGVQRGQDALRTSIGRSITPGRNLDRTTPDAFERWTQGVSAPERQAAQEGVLGATKEDLFKNPVRNLTGLVPGFGGRAAGHAPSLLRSINTPRQQSFNAALRALFAGTNALSPQQ